MRLNKNRRHKRHFLTGVFRFACITYADWWSMAGRGGIQAARKLMKLWWLKLYLQNSANILIDKQHGLKATICNPDCDLQFRKWNLTIHIHRSQQTVILVIFPSDVLRLLCLNSVIHRGSWKQHVGCLQTEAAAADRQSSRRTSERKPEDIFMVKYGPVSLKLLFCAAY